MKNKCLAIGILLFILMVSSIGTLSIAQGQVFKTLESCDSAGNTKDLFNVGEAIWAKGTGLTPGGSYDIYVVPDQVNWGSLEGQNIPAWNAKTTITVDGSGNFKAVVWSSAQYGPYDLVLDVNGDGKYQRGGDLVDSDDIGINVNTAGLFVVPEYLFGGLAALGACFIGFALFKKRSSLPQLRSK